MVQPDSDEEDPDGEEKDAELANGAKQDYQLVIVAKVVKPH